MIVQVPVLWKLRAMITIRSSDFEVKKHPYTDGVIFGKVANYAKRHQHPERLTHPLKRVGSKGTGISAFEKISWEESLDLTAASLKQIA